MGNIDKAKNDFDILEQWLKGPDKHDDYWGTAIFLYYSLFQYYQGINNNDRALEMLKNAYDSADKRGKRQYLEYRDSGRPLSDESILSFAVLSATRRSARLMLVRVAHATVNSNFLRATSIVELC